MSEISLRDATIEDAGAIARIHVDSWLAAYRGLICDAVLDGRTVHGQTEVWREILASTPEVLLAVAQVGDRNPHASHSDLGGTVLGFCALRREPDRPVEIAARYLDPNRFRSGIGSALMRETLDRLRAAGESEVTLEVLEGNHRARAFYVRHGFSETGERGRWHGAPELRMRRALTS